MSPQKTSDSSFQFSVTTPIRLDVFLSEQLQESRSFVQTQILEGRVSVNGQVVTKTGTRLKPGNSVEGRTEEPQSTNATPVEGPLDILFEDETLLVLNKADGVVVHPGAGTVGPTLVHHVLFHLQDTPFETLSPVRPGIVHRLDRGTTGVLVIAKTRHALEHLSAQFKDRTTRKTYQAVAWGELPERGTWNSPVGRDRRNRKKMSSRTDVPRDALTRWERRGRGHGLSWVELYPTTGRTHQLRVHLSEGGFPIVGDPLYGGVPSAGRLRPLPEVLANALQDLDHTLLHAARLEVNHPKTGKRLTFTAPLPSLFETVTTLL